MLPSCCGEAAGSWFTRVEEDLSIIFMPDHLFGDALLDPHHMCRFV